MLDTNTGMPILSDIELQLNEDIIEFILTHLEKITVDADLKEATITEESHEIIDWCLKLKEDSNSFIDITTEIAKKLYDYMLQNVSIPSGDCIFVLMEEAEQKYLCFLKLAYSDSYIHYVEQDGEKKVNTIIKQKTALPNINQKISEAFIINLESMQINLKEKEYDIDGVKDYYMSKYFLKCDTGLTEKEKIAILNKTSKKFVKKYYDDDVSKIMEVKKIVVENIDEEDTMNIEKVATKMFKGDEELKQSYIAELENKGLDDQNITISEDKKEKVFKKQKIVTDTGVEIKLPYDYIGNSEKIEFINNVDGTISILIKDVNKLLGK
ncbi:nucleoid-associated protein [Clostridiaceae bacterium M8S5]|nr:nucleoid-associated protein [Clostridiaceae bacterium M8S5]